MSSLKRKREKANVWHFLMRHYTRQVAGVTRLNTPNSLLPGISNSTSKLGKQVSPRQETSESWSSGDPKENDGSYQKIEE